MASEINVTVEPKPSDIVVNLSAVEIIAVATGDKKLLNYVQYLMEWAEKNRCRE